MSQYQVTPSSHTRASKIEAASFFDSPYAPAILVGTMVLCGMGGAVAILSMAGTSAGLYPSPN